MFRPTIRKKIFIYIFSLTTLSMIIISLAIFFLFFQTLKKNEVKSAIEASDKTKQSIEFMLKLIVNTGTSIGSNKELLDELNKGYSVNEDSEYPKGQNKISTMLQNIISVQEYIKGIYVLSPKGNFYTSNWGVKEDELKVLYNSYIRNGETAKEYFTGIHEVTYHPILKSSVISYIRPIFDLGSEKIIGAVIIDIDYDHLKELLTISSIENDEKVQVVDAKGENIFSYYLYNLDDVIKDNPIILQKQKIQFNGKVFGDDSIILSNTIDFSNWKIIKVISSRKIHQDTINLETMAVYIFIIYIFISFIVSLILSLTLTNPITELNNKFKSVENGDLSVSIKVKSKDEIGQLNFSFNNMVIKLKMLISSLLEEQKKKSDMEFQILQAQINPHFLYNTLDSIKWLAVIQNVSNIGDMTTALINLLRYNISKNDPTVSLAEEIESINNYVKIQKYRYGDMFSIEYSIAEDTQDCKIIKFILQPIVENAIIHGFENLESKGVITINSKIVEDDLIIEVIDNGAGIDHDILNSINNNEDFKKKFSAIGVNNIQERIKVYFGEKYGLSFSSKLKQGTKVSLKLPVIKS